MKPEDDDPFAQEGEGMDDIPEEDTGLPEVTTLEELKAAIAAKHRVAIGDDDPALIAWTMHGLFLGDYEKMLKHHNGITRKFLTETGDIVTARVEDALKVLKEETLSSSVENMLTEIRTKVEENRRIERAIAHHRGAFVAMTLLCLLVGGMIIFVELNLI